LPRLKKRIRRGESAVRIVMMDEKGEKSGSKKGEPAREIGVSREKKRGCAVPMKVGKGKVHTKKEKKKTSPSPRRAEERKKKKRPNSHCRKGK